MMPTTSRIAVLMTCHNRCEVTLRSLSALAHAAQGLCFDVYLVDDGSSDGTGEFVRCEFPFVHVVQGDGNLYWAKGMRLAWETAVKSADYDFYLWLNDDLMLKPTALRGVWADFEATKGVIVGTCSQDECETICSYGASDEKDRKITPCGTPQKANGWLNGNCVLVPKNVFQNVGMISGEYAHARADYDYAEKLKKAGVSFYASSEYVGVCRDSTDEKIRGKNLCQRIALLWQPSYWNIIDTWRIRNRYHGVCRAVISCLHLITMVVFMRPKNG